MLRILLTGWLALLLVGFQQERIAHELQHDRARLAEQHDTGLHNSGAETPCAWCALLAGGTHGVASPGAGHAAPTAESPHALAHAIQAFVRPSFHYASRGPPLPV